MILQDPRLRATFIATILLSGLIVLVTQIFGEDDSFPFVVALIMLMSVVQMGLLFFWNGGPSSSNLLVVARKMYMEGRFDDVVEVLSEADLQTADAPTLALLGNTYRQLKKLDESEQILQDAVQRFPEDKLVLYGLGRTLMVKGEYTAAAKMIDRALANEGRNNIRVELAQALYYASDDPQQLLTAARQAARVLNLEQYRTLFINYLLYNLLDSEKDVAGRMMHVNREGIVYWQSEARRFADFPYGRQVAGDVVAMRDILAEMETMADDGK